MYTHSIVKERGRMLAIIVPAYNEAKNLPLLGANLALFSKQAKDLVRVVLVNNGSTDNTAEVLVELERKYDFIKILTLPVNQHFGGAIKAGLKSIDADLYGYIPADNQITVSDLENLYNKFDNNYDIVKGNRTLRLDPWLNRLVSKVYNALTKLILKNTKIRDVNALPKLFNQAFKEHLLEVPVNDFSFEAAFALLANKNNCRVLEVPVTLHTRTEGVSSWGKKRMLTYGKVFLSLFALRKHYLK